MTPAGSQESRLRVFISYSRKDEDFAEDLLAGLMAVGFSASLDKHDIAAGEDWEARLGRLIEGADTVVFVISPDSIKSERCFWEVEKATALKKRLLPIVWRSVEDALVPSRLRQLNYIFFDRPHSFGASLYSLSTALRLDVDWVREHSRIGEAALRWATRERPEALLFRGEELATANVWLSTQPQFAPEPTILHYEFIRAADDAKTARESAERRQIQKEAAAQAELSKALASEKVAQQASKRALRRGQRTLAAATLLFASLVTVSLLSIAGVLDRYYLEAQFGRIMDGVVPSVLTSRQESTLKLGDKFQECWSCPEMVFVGPLKTHPNQAVFQGNTEKTLSPFAFAAHEVTFYEWDVCFAHRACRTKPDDRWGRGSQPVINVSWDDIASEYIPWIPKLTGKRYRLPTLQEWEFAGRAGGKTAYFWGDDPVNGRANCYRCGSRWDNIQTAPVRYFSPNAFGIYDVMETFRNGWRTANSMLPLI
jgi:formylglycine-generating enzyme required for sulfatase activity